MTDRWGMWPADYKTREEGKMPRSGEMKLVGAWRRWRGAGRVLRAEGKGQAQLWRWELVPGTKDPPRKEGAQMLFTPSLATLTVVWSSEF